MLLLRFEINGEQYVIDTQHVVEIVPLVKFKKVPRAAEYFSGMINFRGKIIPVVDLKYLACEQYASTSFSTRIIIINYPLHDGQYYQIGVVAERIVETIKRNDDDFQSWQGVVKDQACFIEAIPDADGMLMKVNIENMLPREVVTDIVAMVDQSIKA